MKKIRLAGLIVLCTALLCSCAAQKAAPEATPAPSAHPSFEDEADYAIHDEHFAAGIGELVDNFEAFQGQDIYLEGYVQRYPEGENYDVQFAVLRDYFSGQDDVFPFGIDCYYEGTLPEEGDWVRVLGTLSSYEDAAGDAYIMLMAQKVETVPDGQHGGRLIYG